MSMRSLVIAFLLPVLSSAQQYGTKKDALSAVSGSSGSPTMPLLQMLLALAIVFALLKFALPKVASKLSKKLVTGVDSSIRIEESANFAGGSLYVVSARGKTLLLSVGSSGVSCIADLTSSKSEPEPPLFTEILEASVAQPTPVEPVAASSPNPDEIQRALERLSRLDALSRETVVR